MGKGNVNRQVLPIKGDKRGQRERKQAEIVCVWR